MKAIAFKVAMILLFLIVLIQSCQDPNCASCIKDPTICKSCKPGFRLSQNKCQPCDDPNCSQCN